MALRCPSSLPYFYMLNLAFLLCISPFRQSNDALSEAEVKFIDETIRSYETSTRTLCPAPTSSDGLGNVCLCSLILGSSQTVLLWRTTNCLPSLPKKMDTGEEIGQRNFYCIQKSNEVLLVSCIYLCVVHTTR